MTFLVLQHYHRNCIWWSWKSSKTQIIFSIHLQNLWPLPISPWFPKYTHVCAWTELYQWQVASTNQSMIPNIHTRLCMNWTLPETSCLYQSVHDSQHSHTSVHNLNFTRDKLPLPISPWFPTFTHVCAWTELYQRQVASTNQSMIPNIHTRLCIIWTLPETSCLYQSVHDSQNTHTSLHNLLFTSDKLPLPISPWFPTFTHVCAWTELYQRQVASTNQSMIPNIHTRLCIIWTLPETSCLYQSVHDSQHSHTSVHNLNFTRDKLPLPISPWFPTFTHVCA